MDVTCNSCSTEYEFETALVSPRGTTVKCTQCGHLFKVQRAESAVAAALTTHWTLRRTDGTTHKLEDLSELTQLVRQGTFGRDDELSRTGKVWRRLGDIEDLDEHFVAADRRGPSRTTEPREPSLRQRTTSQTRLAALGAAGATDDDLQQEHTAGDAHAADVMTPEDTDGASPPARHEPPAPKANPPHAPIRLQPTAPSLSDQLDDEPTAVAPKRSLAARSDPPAQDVDVDKDVESRSPAQPGSSRTSWEEGIEAVRTPGLREESRRRASVRLLTSSALVAGLAFWFFSMPPTAAPTSSDTQSASSQDTSDANDPSERFLSAGDATLSRHRPEQFDTALVEYIKALAFHEHDTHILSAISRVRALWAQELLNEIELGQIEAPGDASAPAKEALERQAHAHAQLALRYARAASETDPDSREALLVSSDALRLTGDLPAAREAFERAVADTAVSAEALRVSALLALAGSAADDNAGDLQAATELARKAVEADPHLLRARLLLARLLASQRDTDAAREQLQVVTRADPQHPLASRIEHVLDHPAAEQLSSDSSATGRTPPGTADQDGYIERGNGLLEAGQLGPAKRMFEHALTLQPDSASAHVGLGQVFVARGRPLQAIDQYVAGALAGDAEALILLADTYRRLGRQREALTAYQSYLQQNPNGPRIEFAKTQLARLEEQFASARRP